MDEEQFREVEATLLYISEARQRAEKGIRALEKLGAKEHLVDALRQSEQRLRDLHRSVMHATYFADATYEDDESVTGEQPTIR